MSSTLGEVMAAGNAVQGWCPQCSRSRLLDLPALAVAYGEQLTLAELKRRQRCKACGGRIEIVVSGMPPDAEPMARHTKGE